MNAGRMTVAVVAIAIVAAMSTGCTPDVSSPGEVGISEQAAVVPTQAQADAGAEVERVLMLGGGAEAYEADTAVAAGADPGIASVIEAGRQEALEAAARCAGRNGVRRYSSWWQGTVVVVMLNSCNASRLAAALAAGAGAATLVAILSVAGAVPGGIVAAVLAIGSAAIWYCTSNGTGLEIHKAWYGSWCTNQ